MAKRRKRKHPLLKYLKDMGHTNRLADAIMLLLAAGLVGSFILAYMSIKAQYLGALACWTAVFAPIGTAASIVLARTVEKSRAENTGADGEGVKYAAAKASNFGAKTTTTKPSNDSPAI